MKIVDDKPDACTFRFASRLSHHALRKIDCGDNGACAFQPTCMPASTATKIEGGESRIGDIGEVGARASVSSSADAVLNQSAFDQNITQGANIQFNSITIQAAGGDVNDGDTA